jgi:hypothetical protein
VFKLMSPSHDARVCLFLIAKADQFLLLSLELLLELLNEHQRSSQLLLELTCIVVSLGLASSFVLTHRAKNGRRRRHSRSCRSLFRLVMLAR